MTPKLTPAQRAELKELLLERRRDLQAQMAQNRENLAPAVNHAGSVSQDESARLSNQTREVDATLTALDAADLARMGEGGLCLDCPVCTFPNCGFGK